MNVTYLGTGSTFVEGCGVVASGKDIDVPDAVGEALVRENPAEWRRAARPKEAKKAGGGD